MQRVSCWVTGQQYALATVSLFLQDPDDYLEPQALDGRHVEVTHEKPEDSTERVRIPNVSMGVGVAFMDAQSDILASLRDALLPRIISGELRVTQSSKLLQVIL